MALAMLAAALLGASQPAADCQPIPGWDQVLARTEARYIVLGEIHGTAETPAMFADAVCHTVAEGPVVVAVEQADTAQDDIDAFMASNGGDQARRAFLASPIWQHSSDFTDGRSSVAMFAMFERLRALREGGADISVVAFQHLYRDVLPEPEQRERDMAAIIQRAARADARVLVFVGNAHAMLTPVQWAGGYLPLAAHLPGDETLTLNILPNGGESWSCTGQPTVCGVSGMGTAPDPQPRHVAWTPGEDQPYSAMLFLGEIATASPPQPAQQ